MQVRLGQCLALGLLVATACGDDSGATPGTGDSTGVATRGGGPAGDDGAADADADTDTDTDTDGTASTGGGSTDGGDATGTDDTGPGQPGMVDVHLVADEDVPGAQRINFAVPLQAGQLSDGTLVRVMHEGAEVPATSRGLAPYGDGSYRSVQIQLDLEVIGSTTVSVAIGGEAGLEGPERIPVQDTLTVPDGSEGPRVWAVLPGDWLAASGIGGPLAPASAVEGTALAAWLSHCDYATWDTAAFLAVADDNGPWLFDRGTALGRAYAITGDLVALRSQYREAAIYGMGITGEGADIVIPVPGASGDAKYHYTQNLAMHYLLTGDDRFRERAEDVAGRMAQLWPSPGYAGGADFWTERHAGFALLAYVHAAAVSDDAAATYLALADEVVVAYLDLMATYPEGYDDPNARCFAHHADAHGEGYGYFGCSPWMSAILADGLEQYAILRGGAQADDARAAIVSLGRILAQQGTDAEGRPLYWMGVGTDQDEVDGYDEHWGESAYVIAMAWHHAAADEPVLRDAADALVAGLAANGQAPHVRSYNWQCRSAVAAPWYLLR